MAITKMTIRDFGGTILGYIEIDDRTGNKTVRDFYNRILGYYDAAQNVTTDFYRRIVARGDASGSLIGLPNK